MSREPKEPEPGYVYVFRDPLNNNLIKVGLSKDPAARRMQLHTTGTALPMNIYHVWHVSDKRLAESAAHAILDDHRVNGRREFFEIAPLPYFSDFERRDYDITSDFLDALIERIEEGFDYWGISYRMAGSEEIFNI